MSPPVSQPQEETATIDVVNAINNDLWPLCDGDQSLLEDVQLTYESNGDWEAVNWLGFAIWRSEQDTRDEDEHGNYEPLDTYLRREMKRMHQVLGLVHKLPEGTLP